MNTTLALSEKVPKITVLKREMIQIGKDEILFDQVKHGNESAFETLFRSYYAILCHYANSYLKDMDEAEEIVQGVFFRIWEKKHKINIDTSFKAYIYQSVRNKSLNYLRNKKTQSSHLTIIDKQDYQENMAIEELSAVELQDKLFEVLEMLPTKCKQIFIMSRFEGMKHQEIADNLDLKVKTIENQIGIALKFLKTQLSEYLYTIIFLLFNLF